jgi:formamidopyrimidine-DNA glycosylase
MLVAMPELPEVEMVARTLRPRLVGRRLVAVSTSGLPLRRPIDRRRLEAACGAAVQAVRRIGKYLLVDLSSSEVLLTHLGMSGRWLFAATSEPRAPHTHVVFRLDDGGELRYVDHRRFGVLQVYRSDEVRASPELAELGLDPLEPGFTVEYLTAQLRATHRDVKGFLLDQTRIAGIGNIYASEALHHAAIGPRRRTTQLGAARIARLHAAIVAVLERGIANRGTSFSDYVDADGASGGNQHQLAVYGKEGEPCPRCSAKIKRLVQSARSTFYCPRCQR